MTMTTAHMLDIPRYLGPHDFPIFNGTEAVLSSPAVKAADGEAAHFKELFSHLKVSYIEEDTREKLVP